MIELKMLPYINNWEIWISNTGHIHLRGNVFNSDKFQDGTLISTSRVLKVDEDNIGYKIETLNSSYYCIKKKFNDFGWYSLKETIDKLNSL